MIKENTHLGWDSHLLLSLTNDEPSKQYNVAGESQPPKIRYIRRLSQCLAKGNAPLLH